MSRLQLGNAVFWIEWRHYFADNALSQPQVVLKNHQVVDMNRAAARKGVAIGMRKHQFRAIAQDCVAKNWESDPERWGRWLDLCVPYSGCIEPIAENIAAMDFSEHPAYVDLAHDLHAQLVRLDFGDLRTAFGPSKWVARILAHLPYPVGLQVSAAEALAPLDVSALTPIPSEDLERLRFLGYHTIGEVAQLPLATLKTHFRESAFVISQAAKGLLLDEVKPLYPQSSILDHFRFSEPIECLQTLELALEELVRRLAPRLDGRQASLAVLTIECDDGTITLLERKLKRPVYGATGVGATLRTMLDQMGPEGSIVRITAKLDNLEPVASRQRAFFVKDHSVAPETSSKALRAAYGDGSIVKASEVGAVRRKEVLRGWKHATGWD